MTIPSESVYLEPDLPAEKVCNQCGQSKPLLEGFPAQSTGRFGRTNKCRLCISQNTKQWRKDNPEKAKERDRRTYLKHRDYILSKCKRWRKDNPEHARETKHKYYAENKEKAYLSAKAAKAKKPDKYRLMNKMSARNRWASRIVTECGRRAKKKGVPFDMTPFDLLDPNTGNLPEFCRVFTDIRLDYNAGPDRRAWGSVDRIVPELGYVRGNVWVISLAANTWKLNGSSPKERKRIIAIMNGPKKKEPAQDQPSLFD